MFIVHSSLPFAHLLVRVAPQPLFAGFGGGDDGVARAVKMFGGVLVFGIIAAAGFAAGLAGPQVHPFVAGLDALDAHGVVVAEYLLDGA
jgi:hypothetical protein